MNSNWIILTVLCSFLYTLFMMGVDFLFVDVANEWSGQCKTIGDVITDRGKTQAQECTMNGQRFILISENTFCHIAKYKNGTRSVWCTKQPQTTKS